MKKSYLFLANGFEEIEALATVDVLRRAGVPVTTVSINPTNEVEGAHGVVVNADTTISECDFEEIDWLILPGGMPGAKNLVECTPLTDLLKEHNKNGGRIAAICASPGVVLAPLGLLNGKKATCYPGFENGLKAGGAVYTGLRVTVDGNFVTGNGPSSAIPFALTIAAETVGKEVAAEVASGMLCD